MNKFDKEIVVVPREKLFSNHYFQGFSTHGDGLLDFESRILDNMVYMRRGDAETDPNFKQPIAYVLIVNPELKHVFTYQRANHEACGEERLRGKISWGTGGHIERIDGASNPIKASLDRELGEEVIINGSTNVKVLGYINDDSEDVGRVHFGVLYLVETDASVVLPRDPEIRFGSLIPIELLEILVDADSPKIKVEEWSKIAFQELKHYLRERS